MRINFFEVFKANPDGSLTPMQTIKIGGVMLGSGSVRFGRGVVFAGVNIFDHHGQDIEVEMLNGIIEIKGFYQ